MHHVTIGKDKNQRIVPRDAEGAFDKIQHSFMIKPLKLETEAQFLNPIKDIYKTLSVNRFYDEGLNALPLKYRQDSIVHSHHFYSTPYWKFHPGQ